MNDTHAHAVYLAALQLVADRLPVPDATALAAAKAHLQNWPSCPDCRREAEAEAFPAEETLFDERHCTYLRTRFPEMSVGLAKLREGAAWSPLCARLEGKHLYAQNREADRHAAGLFLEQALISDAPEAVLRAAFPDEEVEEILAYRNSSDGCDCETCNPPVA